MDAEPGRSLILWTVRVSVALYAIAVLRYAARLPTSTSPDRIYRCSWTSSWVLCIVHVVCAFHFEHHWNHDVALTHTAKMTERVVGIYWGGGLYINYLFLTWWGIDVVRLYRSTSATSSRTMQAVAAFMMFNATVVFGPRWWIIPTSACATLLLWNYVRAKPGKHNG